MICGRRKRLMWVIHMLVASQPNINVVWRKLDDDENMKFMQHAMYEIGSGVCQLKVQLLATEEHGR
jgi:hypothetical protein